MNDSAIIELYWNRDETASQETDALYGRKLCALSDRILNSNEDAKECVNDTYLEAWKCIPPKKPAHFYAFLSKIYRYLFFL